MNNRSLTPAQDEIEARAIREKIEKCGKNLGPHDYIPIEWRTDPETMTERVTRLICRVCFRNVDMATLIASYEDVSHAQKIGNVV